MSRKIDALVTLRHRPLLDPDSLHVDSRSSSLVVAEPRLWGKHGGMQKLFLEYLFIDYRDTKTIKRLWSV